MKSLLAGLSALGAARLAALAAVAAATLGLLFYLVAHASGAGPMTLLYGDLDLRDAGAMADLLDKAHIPHALNASGTTILVPRALVAQARLDMARAALPSGGSIGYEIFDRGDGLTESQFQQDINQTRALEGELTRSIRLLRGVRDARVHLVLPRNEAFAEHPQQAQASVLLTFAGAARLDHEGVQAVLNLVAAAVPGLKPQDIAVIDDRGEVLARAGAPSDGAGLAATEDEARDAMQARLSQAVETMLERSLGAGHVRAEASVEMDFDRTSETAEKYDPDGQVSRSTQSVTDSSKTSERPGSVSVQNNLPNPDPSGGGGGTEQQRQEETTNYEIGKTTRTVVHDQPKVGRISLAVMVDGITVADKDGKPFWQARPPEELARIAALARGVIGFDESRGDKVEVVSMRFIDDTAPPPAPRGLLAALNDPDALSLLVQTGLPALVILIVALAVLRPLALRLAAAAARALAGTPALAATAAAGRALAAPAGPAGLLTDESMVDIGNVEGQIRASSIRRIAELVDKHPEESLAIVRSWMAQEPA